jgi:hypothetical protein
LDPVGLTRSLWVPLDAELWVSGLARNLPENERTGMLGSADMPPNLVRERRPEDTEHLLDGLRKAGIIE